MPPKQDQWGLLFNGPDGGAIARGLLALTPYAPSPGLLGGYKPTQLSPEQEKAFQRDMQFAPGWSDQRRMLMRRYGETPNYDSGNYDYRGAWLYGLTPQEVAPGEWHGSSSTNVPPYAEPKPLKAPGHPTEWKEAFYRLYRTDPDKAPGWMLADALKRGIVIPGTGQR